uniref:Cytochrome bc subunit VI PetL n=1 Tax=Heliobacterium mobile TaxID=28064 RepID=Q9ZGG4_HELMO|nr:cytochrome bc subunit VI PetL [Heliobacterium mobile]
MLWLPSILLCHFGIIQRICPGSRNSMYIL